jgi:hypothetical protein
MRRTLIHSACALGLACASLTACSKDSKPSVSAAEQRRIDERRAEERRAEERRAEERRREERLAAEVRAERREAERRDDERLAADRLAEQRRIEEKRVDERRDAKVRTTPDPVLRATASSAVTSLAAERCDREVRCNNIGAKEKYKTRADCIAELERDKRDDLNTDVCPGGIRQKELGDCLKAIRDESCGNPLDRITRLAACRSGNLCAK